MIASLLLALAFAGGLGAAIDPLPFRDAAEEARFRRLAAELRCLVCQNQSLADSDAPLARDLRREVLRLMQEGLSDEQVKAYLVERYSDFVLYRPPLRPDTLPLWLTPAAVLVLGGLALLLALRRHARLAAARPPAAGEESGEEEP
ncbi:MAG: cytochrome c-type biogenesis protein CcmH [Geminicoccaceae bacterium]|nr:cytochrome c-type biogenesis protein CcmH [Geminicoccaceae bacterium]MDW8479773.1 cytochrome c-type biogenesis protein [Xanthomonadales bacterium]